MSTMRQQMMTDVRLRDVATGKIYRVDPSKPLGNGGEAGVYAVDGDPSKAAKIYWNPTPERARKLEILIANPPNNPTAKKGHNSFALPIAAVSGVKENQVIGFLMPRIRGMKEVFNFYNPKARRELCPFFDYRYLHTTARNIAWVMEEVHSIGYVIGDVNQKNVFVSDSALVTLIDTDSFQIADPVTGSPYLCTVDTDDFRAPERKGKDPTITIRTKEQDRWGLGVLIFHLLMEGVHPFAARYESSDRTPTIWENVVAGGFPYGNPNTRYKPMPVALDFETLHPNLRAMFQRCFVDGHSEPGKRPTAAEWRVALYSAMKELKSCAVNAQHFYGQHLGSACPWCARVKRGFFDSFPAKPKPGVHSPVPPPRGDRHRERETIPQTIPPPPEKKPNHFLTLVGVIAVAIGILKLIYWFMRLTGSIH